MEVHEPYSAIEKIISLISSKSYKELFYISKKKELRLLESIKIRSFKEGIKKSFFGFKVYKKVFNQYLRKNKRK